MSDDIRRLGKLSRSTPKGFTITFPDDEGVRVFINEKDAEALRKLGKRIAIIPDKDELVMGGSVYINCET